MTSQPKRKSGIRAALEHTGIPPSWFNKRPKLPSRNWLIFLGVTSSLTGLYIYDRRECRRIKEEYVSKVKYLADKPTGSLDPPRKVTVYGAKMPGDDDWDISMRYFRKYVKPILASAAIDYELIRGRRHGDIAERVAEDIRLKRRKAEGIDSALPHELALPTYKSPEQQTQYELEGGIVIVGRPTWKEFMAGLKKGWSNGLHHVDKDALLAEDLEKDPIFDEGDDSVYSGDDPKHSTLPSALGSAVFNPLQNQNQTSFSAHTKPSLHEDVAPPSIIPPLPPLLFVPFTNYVGFKQVPYMIYGFFNQRSKVLSGAQAGYRIVKSHTRAFVPPKETSEPLFSDITAPLSDGGNINSREQGGDLDFGLPSERFYANTPASMLKNIDSSRTKFYSELPAKLHTARALDRRTREPTKDEVKYPPPTENELRQERFDKEKKWRKEEWGLGIVNPAKDVEWDGRFNGRVLRVFVDPPKEQEYQGWT